MIVLLYHRVCSLATDPQLLCVSPKHFEEQLDVLRRQARIVPLAESTQSEKSQETDNRVAITFDDGYADNLENALPLLVRFDAPATVFVTTRPDRSRREFWWDALEAGLLWPCELPRKIQLRIGRVSRSWELGESAVYRETDFQRHRGWSVTMPSATARQACYLELCDALRPLPFDEQLFVLDQIDEYRGAPVAARATHRCLDDVEIRRLAASGLIEIGAHSVTHPVLSARSQDEQAWEIRHSKRTLEETIDRRVESFSYPYGTKKDYSIETVSNTREAGYARACANFAGTSHVHTDPYQIPRHLVRDWSGETLGRRLRDWLNHG